MKCNISFHFNISTRPSWLPYTLWCDMRYAMLLRFSAGATAGKKTCIDQCKYSIKLLPFVTLRCGKRAHGSALHLRGCAYGSELHLRQFVHTRSSESYHFGEPSRAEPTHRSPKPVPGLPTFGLATVLPPESRNLRQLEPRAEASRAETHRCPKPVPRVAHFHQGPFMTPQLLNG